MAAPQPSNNQHKVVLVDPTSKERVEHIRAALPPSIRLEAVTSDSEEEVARLIADAEVLVIGRHRIDDQFLDLAPRVRFIQRSAAGYDNVDVAALKRRGILMANNAGANAAPVAEYAILLMLALLKRFVLAVNETRAGGYPRGQFSGNPDLDGATVGIIGFGATGQAVAQRLRGFGSILRYYSRRRVADDVEERFHVQYLPLDELLSTSSIITVHVSLNEQTRRFLGEAEFARMPQGALFINTARGNVVDEGALLRALQSGYLGGAGLDVLDYEGPGHNPLYDLPNVIVTPHTAGSSRMGSVRSLQVTIDNIVQFLQGGQPAGIISELRGPDEQAYASSRSNP